MGKHYETVRELVESLPADTVFCYVINNRVYYCIAGEFLVDKLYLGNVPIRLFNQCDGNSAGYPTIYA